MTDEILERDQFLAEVKQTVTSYLDTVMDAKLVFVTTVDGHLVYEINREGIDLAELTPMTATLAALAGSIAERLDKGELNDVIIRTEEANLVAICMGDEETSLVFAALAGARANLGLLLTAGRECSVRLMEIFSQMK